MVKIATVAIPIERLNYNKATKTFSAYASDLQLNTIEKEFTVLNGKTGKSVNFVYRNADMDSTGEDTYGWNYVGYNPASDESYRLLIIND